MSKPAGHGPQSRIPRRDGAPKPQMTAWQRWEMAAVDQPSAVEEPPPPPAMDISLTHLEPKLLIDEAELERLRQEAQQAGATEGHQQGYGAGWQEGYAAAQEIARQEAAALQALAQSLPVALRSAERELADDLLALALDIARQVVRQELTIEPQHVLAAVRELLQTEPALSGTPRLLLHADDMPLVQQYLSEDLQAAGWLLRSDPAISRGGCRVEASSGELDATLETRWQRVAAALGRQPTKTAATAHD